MAAAPKLFPSMETSQGNAYSFDYSEYDEAKTRNSLKTHNYNKNTANMMGNQVGPGSESAVIGSRFID